MILVLLLIEPALSFLKLDEHLNYYFDSFSTLWEVDEGTLDFDAIEEKSYKKVLEQYKSQIKTQINKLAEDENLEVTSCNIILNEDNNSEDYGTIERISLKVSEDKNNTTNNKNSDIEAVNIDDIKIETNDNNNGSQGNRNQNIYSNNMSINNQNNYPNNPIENNQSKNNNISTETSYNNNESDSNIEALKGKIIIYYPISLENIDISN